MRISYTKFSTFMQNPERYRLSYMLGLTPESKTWDTPMTYGMRRGRCFHALLEGTPVETLEKEYGARMVAKCQRLLKALPDLGPLEMVEQEFDIPILDSPHTLKGRIDHLFKRNGEARLGDFKTTKPRTKKEFGQYLEELSTSPQAAFYLYAARRAGLEISDFTFHVLISPKDDEKEPEYFALDLHIGPVEVDRAVRSAAGCADLIEACIAKFGTDNPWPHSNAWPCCGGSDFCGFREICGRVIPKGCVPPGFITYFKEPESEAA